MVYDLVKSTIVFAFSKIVCDNWLKMQGGIELLSLPGKMFMGELKSPQTA